MRWKPLVAIAAVGGFLLYVFLNDPAQGGFLPCPFRYLTGWLCPGCGSQRALHDLLHGRIGEAFAHNALLIIALAALGSVWIAGRFSPAVRNWTTRNAVVWACLVVVVGWGVVRNVW